MYKIYNVYKNNGDWGGSSYSFIIAKTTEEAMIKSFFGTPEQQKESYNNWILNRNDISANEAESKDFIDTKVKLIKVPDGYNLKYNVTVEIISE